MRRKKWLRSKQLVGKPKVQLGTHFNHEIPVINDDGGPITFQWHWPRGTFDKRMSAYELAQFILPHMPSIAGLLSENKRIHREWMAMLVVLATSPKQAIDIVVPWIKPVIRTQEDDIIELNIGAVAPQAAPKVYFT